MELFVEQHVRIIVYLGNIKMGVEVLSEGFYKELWGELYVYVGAK